MTQRLALYTYSRLKAPQNNERDAAGRVVIRYLCFPGDTPDRVQEE